jgi:SRSO17 transposase
VSPDGMQRLLRTADWNADAVRDELRNYVVERLGPGGVLIVDETGFIKKGSRSAGVARQYTGTTGKIDNCQIGVFLAYATDAGRALIDRELYLPKAWTDDRERARAAGIGEDIGFATKPELARRMLTEAIDAGVPASWLTADEVYGQDKRLRVWCEHHRLPYVLATRSNDTVATVDWRQRRVRALIAELPAEAWQRCSAGAGAHGPRLYDWARRELLPGFDPGWARWVLARRTIPKGSDEPAELAYYVCAGPAETTLEQLVIVAGGRWRIEECFQAAKNEAGLASSRCGTTPPGIGTSRWPCSPMPISPLPAPPRKRGLRRRNRPAHRADRARTPAPAQHPHPHPATRSRHRSRLVLVAPTTPGPGPRRPLPSPRTGTAITAVAVLGRV